MRAVGEEDGCKTDPQPAESSCMLRVASINPEQVINRRLQTGTRSFTSLGINSKIEVLLQEHSFPQLTWLSGCSLNYFLLLDACDSCVHSDSTSWSKPSSWSWRCIQLSHCNVPTLAASLWHLSIEHQTLTNEGNAMLPLSTDEVTRHYSYFKGSVEPPNF